MKQTRLAVLNTVPFLAERFKTMLADRYPDLDSFQMLDESLLQDLMRQGPSDAITARIVAYAQLAEQTGATAILFTCSSTSPAVDAARRAVSIPIIKIDDAMAEQAVLAGERIAIICTTPSTRGPSKALLEEHAQRLGKVVEIEVALREEAYRALMSGDRTRHDAIIGEAAESIAGRCDVIVLAQASLAHLQEPLSQALGVPVLASPELCVSALGSQIDIGTATCA
jgi:Asp/Glu/hydantoin racemase